MRGGVGRNVAECLAKLGQRPFLISVVGDDMAGWWINHVIWDTCVVEVAHFSQLGNLELTFV